MSDWGWRSGAGIAGRLRAHLVAQHAVKHGVVPSAALEGGAAQDALAGESGPLQCPLLGGVGDLGRGFDPVHLRVCEQVPGELSLRLGASPSSPGLGSDRRTD